jgi:hypothetical protein
MSPQYKPTPDERVAIDRLAKEKARATDPRHYQSVYHEAKWKLSASKEAAQLAVRWCEAHPDPMANTS